MPDAMVNHHLTNQAKLDIDTATARPSLLALALVLADVLRLNVGEQHLAEGRLQMLPATLVDAASPRGPMRLTKLAVGIDRAGDTERAAHFLQPARAQLKAAPAFPLKAFRHSPHTAVGA